DEQRNIGGFKVAARHHDRKLLRHQVGLAFAADAGGVDDAELLTVVVNDFIHGIAGCTRNGRNDGACGSSKRVQQSGLAHVGPPDDGEARLVLAKFAVGAVEVFSGYFFFRNFRLFFSFGKGEHGENFIEQAADAVSVLGGNGEEVLDAEAAEVF